MSTTIDEKVVRARFDNNQFMNAIRPTLSALDSLKQKLDLRGATKGLQDVGAAAKGVTLGHLASAVDNISSRFSAMGAVALTTISNITNRAVDAGAQLIKSLTITPLVDGFKEYELGLNSVQTILANTQSSGATLKDVNGTLKELNHYADETIYNFGQMAKNIGTFTAAGVDLETSAASIKGIANLAALSGSSSEQASGAMYQLSQAIAAGRVSLMDWNSVVNAGMGGATFQRALANTAVAMGKLDKGAVKISGSMKNVKIDGESFRDSISATNGESWLTSDVLTNTLKQFTNDLSAAELKAMGFNAAQIKAIQQTAKTAEGAATEVKTLGGLFETTKESIVSGWAESWQVVFGDFEEAKKTFTDFGKVIGDFVGDNTKARIALLNDWKALGGRQAAIDGIKAAFSALASVVRPIRQAFHDIFPPATGKTLADLTKSIRDFFKNLKMGEETAFKVRLIFQGFFAALDIGWILIKKTAEMLRNLFGPTMKEGSSSLFDLAVKIANWVTGLRHALKYGEGLTDFFKGLEAVLRVPVKMFQTFTSVIGAVIDQFGKAAPAVEKVNENLQEVGEAGQEVAGVWDTIKAKFKGLIDFFSSMAPALSEYFGGITDAIRDSFSNGNFQQIIDAVNTGFLGGLMLIFRKFMKDGLQLNLLGGSGITDLLDGVTGSLTAMQQNLKAGALLKIAGAIGILTISLIALAMLDPVKLSIAMGALAVLFTQLSVALLAFDKASSFLGSAKLPLLAAGLTILAVAIGLLTISIKVLATMSWEELLKGLTGLTAILGALVGFANTLSGSAAKMIAAGIGFTLLAVGINLFVLAVKQFADMDWAYMAKGLAGVGAVLGALAIFTRLAALNKMGLANGAGLIMLGVALKIMASAVSDFGGMNLETLGKGIGGMAASLALVAVAMRALPKSIILQAAGLVVVASALGTLADVVLKLGKTDLMTLAVGIGAMAAQLAVLAGGLYLLNGALVGAAALWIAVDALSNLTIVMTQMAAMGLGGTVAALATLAGALTILGVAGLVMAPVLPVLQALGTAILTMGIGAAAAGIGLFAAAAGLVALSATGVAAGVAITAIASAIIGVLPAAMKALAEGIVLMAKVIGDSGPQFVNAMSTLILSLVGAIARTAPRVIDTLMGLIGKLLSAIRANLPSFLQKGIDIVVSVLRGIAQNLPRVLSAAGDLIVAFIRGIGEQALKIVKAAADTVLKFLNGLADAIRANGPAFGQAGANILLAIVQGMIGGVGSFAGMLWDAAQRLAGSFMDGIKSFFGIASPSKEMYKIGQFVMIGFRNGLDGNKDQVQGAFENLKKMLSDGMRNMKEDVNDLTERLAKLKKARRKDWDEIRKTTAALAKAKKEYAQMSSALNNLNKNWTDDKNRLGQLATQYDAVGEKIKAANDKLKDAQKTRDDYAKSIKDQYSDLPDIVGGDKPTTAVDYAASLRKQIADTQAFASALQKLRTMGLNDTLYKELLAKGPEAMPFIQDLLNTGSTGVKQLNDLSSQLASVSGSLGSTASKQLYQAAVDSAAGLVKGLQNQQAAIEKQMDIIANAMVASIKRSLGIKSPSRKFMEVGKFSAEGVAVGLKKYSGTVERASAEVGHTAIDSMRKTISGLSDIVDGNLDTRPVISPVLDLTDLQKKAEKIDSLVKAPTIMVGATYESAKKAQAAYHANERAFESEGQPFQEPVVQQTTNFTQNNYSPKALSEAEVYRQTKSLISTTKGEVNP